MARSELDYLIELFSSSIIRTMSGNKKRVYKYSLCGIFINIIIGNHKLGGQISNFQFIEGIRKSKLNRDEYRQLLEFTAKPNVHKSFDENGFIKPYNDALINNIIAFMRDKLNTLKDSRVCLFHAKELSQFLDINAFFKFDFVSGFHWVEFGLVNGLVVTIPEGIIFNDLKVQWNSFIDTHLELRMEHSKVFSPDEEFEFYKDEKNREKQYKWGAIYRNLIFLGVSFVESYLYDLFCCIREMNIDNKDQIAGILKEDKVQDAQIIEQVLYKLYPDLKGQIEDLYKRYKTINDYRDRYVHASPLIDSSNNTSHLKPLLDLDVKQLCEFLQVCLDLVKQIDDFLPKQLNLLFWWYNEEIIFADFKKISLTNSDARINKIDFNS